MENPFVFSTLTSLWAIFLLMNCSDFVDGGDWVTCSGIVPQKNRSEMVSIKKFGGVGDGVTLNTKAFKDAIHQIELSRTEGGTVLYIPPGEYLTGPFNLTSHMTLYLAKDAVIKAITDTERWPLIAPLPSYGRGRELPGGRYMSFIHMDGLQDVIITGENGTIDGQGDVWWNMWRRRTLKFTRPNNIELMNSENIIISHVIFKNSPFWNIHPVYCSNIVIQHVTILAPADSPNTDGIDPDSSSHVCIEDSFISTVGSEMSGGVEDILVEHITLHNMGIGIHLKTNNGRGGVIRNITFSNIYMENVRIGIKISGNVGDHPDEKYNPNALPILSDITIKDVWGEKVQQPGLIRGLKDAPFTGICLSNITLDGSRNLPWQCSDVSGGAVQVSPWPCSELTSNQNLGACSSSF